MADNIFIGKEATKKLLKGIDKAALVISMSYGPSGSNVLLGEDLYPFHSVTNDGKSIVDKMKLEDPIEQMGVDIMKEIGDKAEKDSGDGRKTTMILANAILKEAQSFDESPMDIKRSLDECLPIILKSLDEQKKEITPDEVGAVAAIAAESPKIGALLQEVYQAIGKDGIVELDVSNTFDTYFDIREGIRFRNAGYMAPYMANDGDKAVYKKPHILITKQKINTVADIDPLFQKLSGDNIHEVIIYCDEIDKKVLDMLAFTHSKGVFKTLIIKAPTLWKDWFFEDFAKATGATVIEAANGVTLDKVELFHLGTCDKLISTKEETTLIGIKDLSIHIKELEDLKTEEGKLRASWLNTKAAVLKLGANSESELSYISKKARDGRNAAHLALKDGVVKGAGLCLDMIADSIIAPMDTVGSDILSIALKMPYNQIVFNMGVLEVTDEVYDPALVIKNAVINAISVAGTVLTARAIISLPKVEDNAKIKQNGSSLF